MGELGRLAVEVEVEVEVARMGGRDLSILLQHYEQMLLVPLPGRRLTVGDPEPIEDSSAGTAFLDRTTASPRAICNGSTPATRPHC